MKQTKYYIHLSEDEQVHIIEALNELRNILIAQNKYTDAVDDVIIKIANAKRKKFRVRYI